MAIDSALKRASALSDGFDPITLVIPSGTIAEAVRQTIGNMYSGILAGTGAIWTVQDGATTTWTDKTDESTVWSEQSDESTTWTEQ